MTPFYRRAAWIGQTAKPLLGAALLCFALLGHAGGEPTEQPAASTPLLPSQAEYKVEAKGFTTKASRELIPLQQGQWRLEIETRLLFFRFNEISQFQLHNERVVPLEYVREQGSRKRNQKLVFDWQKGYADNRVKGYEWQSALSHGLLDRLSQQAQLRVDLLNGRLETEQKYQILDRERIKTYAVKKVGEERLTLDNGISLDTVVLEQSRIDGDRVTRIWLAPDWNYLLVKLHQNDEGEESLLTLIEAKVDGQSLQ